MAGDRRATMGNLIASRDIEKVHAADPYSLVGIAGTAGVGIELIKLFQVELEHYEKIEGTMLSLDGKANRLATMVRNNLGAALQGGIHHPADRLSQRVDRGRPTLDQRRPAHLPRDEPARDPPAARPGVRRGACPRRPDHDEAGERERHPDQPLPAASAGAGPGRRARFLGDRRVRSGDPWLRLSRLARESERRSPLAGRLPRPDRAHGRARQEPSLDRHLVPGQRVGNRLQSRPDGHLGPGP